MVTSSSIESSATKFTTYAWEPVDILTSALEFEYPPAEAEIVYCPGGKEEKRIEPESFDSPLLERPVPVLVTETDAPETGVSEDWILITTEPDVTV
tara:strand:+ start:30 stop:317 length:288 start_codon:yes stop_codon:yes gene_type:complete